MLLQVYKGFRMKPLKDGYPVLEQTLCHVLITNQNIFTGRFFSQDVEVCWDDELESSTGC